MDTVKETHQQSRSPQRLAAARSSGIPVARSLEVGELSEESGRGWGHGRELLERSCCPEERMADIARPQHKREGVWAETL